MTKSNGEKEKLAYIFLEGDTESVFYRNVFDIYLRGIPKKIVNLKGGTGINKEVASHLLHLLRDKKNKHINFYVYVFIDREGNRSDIPEFNEKAIIEELGKHVNIKNLIKIDKIEAIIMIESWFFYDLETICRYIGLKCTDSLKNNYRNPEKFTHKDLDKLFRKGSNKKRYIKGEKSFLEKLDVEKIYMNCKDLTLGIDTINKDFK